MKITFVSLHNEHFLGPSVDVPISRKQKLLSQIFFPALNSILDDTEKWFSTKTFFQYIATAVIKRIRPENCTLNTSTERYRFFIHFGATLNSRKSLLSTRSVRGYSLNRGNAEISSQFSRLSRRVGHCVKGN